MFARRSPAQTPREGSLEKAASAPGAGVMDTLKLGEKLMKSGEDAVAQVVSVEHTGMMLNFNPVVVLSLKALTATGERFETTGQSIVSRIAIPKAGDTIRIKYNPADKTQLVVI